MTSKDDKPWREYLRKASTRELRKFLREGRLRREDRVFIHIVLKSRGLSATPRRRAFQGFNFFGRRI